MAVQTRIQVRRGTSSQWSSAVTGIGQGILYQGEIGYDTDTGRFKIGDGNIHWNDLNFASILPTSFIAGSGISLSTGINGSTLTINLSDPTIQVGDITDFNEGVDNRVSNLLIQGSGIGLNYNNGANTLQVSVTGIPSSLVTNFASSVNDLIDNAVSTSIVAGSGVDIVYNSGNNTLTVSSSLTAGSGIAVSHSSGNYTISLSDPTIQSTDITDFVDAVNDRVDDLLKAGSNIQLTYADSGNANSELTISVTGVSLSGHTHTLSNITDVTASATEVNYLDGSIPGTGVAGKAVVLGSNGSVININSITASGSLFGKDIVVNDLGLTVQRSSNAAIAHEMYTAGGSSIYRQYSTNAPYPVVASIIDGAISGVSIVTTGSGIIGGNLTISGDLVVNGTTTTVNSTTTTLDDPIITLGGDTAPTGTDAKDRGVEFRYYDGSAQIGFFGWDNSTGKFTFLTSATNNSEIFSGTTGTIDANIEWNSILNKPDPVVTVNLTGEVTGSGNATLTDLGNGTINISTTIANNTVTLGTDTIGQYASTVSVAGSGLSATTANADDGTAYTITSNATPANISGTIVSRDNNGDFSARNITATEFIGKIQYVDGGTP